MEFRFTEEQNLLRDTLHHFLADRYDFETRRAATESAAGWRPETWRALAGELNILGACFPEALGGLGGGAVDHMIMMEEFGNVLFLEPYLETMVIGGGLLRSIGGPVAAELVPRTIAGEVTLALAMDESDARCVPAGTRLRARRNGDGYVLAGSKKGVQAAPWASHLLVVARSDGAPGDEHGLSVWLVEREAAGVSLLVHPTIDGGRAADIEFNNVQVPATALLGEAGGAAPHLAKVLDEAICAQCAESVGAMRRMLHDTVRYAMQRRQFGMPLAAFQVLQHRIVDMFIAVEQAGAMTHAATLKLDLPAAERARIVSALKVQVDRAARQVGQDAIQIHGGMGITEELSLGHHFRRVTANAARFGGSDFHLRRYAAHALAEGAAETVLDPSYNTEEESFRREVRDWIGDAFDPELKQLRERTKNGYLDKAGQVRWQKKLYEKGWAAPGWPAEYGGPGWTPMQRYIFLSETAASGCPLVSPMGLAMVAYVIMEFGTPEQKERFLPAILASDVFWCQGYSEPESGSDLASLRMKAERDGDHYVLNGSKIWTTHAQWADWIFCLVRTSREDKPQQGISFLLVDMSSPGISVRPLPSLDGPVDGEQEVNQVFFENVRVPVENRIADEGMGWTCAKYLLQFERGVAYAPLLRYQFRKLKELAREYRNESGALLIDDPVFRHRLADLGTQIDALDATEMRFFLGVDSGEAIGALSSMFKLRGTEMQQLLSEVAVEAIGADALPFVQDGFAEIRGRPAPVRTTPAHVAPVAPLYFNYRKTSIYAGTNEIQRNILAKHVFTTVAG